MHKCTLISMLCCVGNDVWHLGGWGPLCLPINPPLRGNRFTDTHFKNNSDNIVAKQTPVKYMQDLQTCTKQRYASHTINDVSASSGISLPWQAVNPFLYHLLDRYACKNFLIPYFATSGNENAITLKHNNELYLTSLWLR